MWIRHLGPAVFAALLAPNGGGDGGGGGGGEKKDPLPTAPTAEEIAALRAKASKYDELDAKSKKDAEDAAAARAAQQSEAEKAGQTQKALDLAKARLAELEPYEAEVKTFREQQTAELKAIEDKKATLSDVQKAALDAAPSLAGKKAVLASFGVSTKVTPPATNPPPPGNPNGPVDFTEAWKSPAAWADAKSKFPQQAAAWLATHLAGGRKPSTIDALRKQPAKSA